jgi:PAS domain S-box-containing protein
VNDPLRILVVEDDADLLFGTARLLERAGYIVDQAADGEGALQAIRQRRPDMILLDRDLPGLDGVGVCRRIKQDPAYADIAIILISSTYTQSNEQADGLDSGADGYIVRPIENRELLARIQAHVRILFLTRALRTKVEELEMAHAAASRSALAALNLLEDAVAARDQANAANQRLQREIEERKRAEAEVQRLTMAIEQAGEAIMVTDAEGTIQYVNPACEAVSGYTRLEVIGQTPRLFKSGKQDESFYRELWDTITDGRIWQGRIVNKRKNGMFYTEETTISPVKDGSGRIVNFVAVKRDITEHLRISEEQARLQEQLQQAQKMESIGRLAGGVAHDFNNLLNVILGYGEIIQQSLHAGDPLREDVEEILRAGRRSADLTRQLLAFGRKQTLQPEVLDLNEVIRNIDKMLRRLIGEDIALDLSLSRELSRVKADPGQIEQVIVNLVVNARDAMPTGGHLLIETGEVELDEAYARDHPGVAPGQYVLLAISDTGCGMEQEVLARVFDPFFTTKEKGKGTGLGLATVYGIVKQSGGNIWAYSEPGQGTTFKIYLPVTGEAAETPSKSAAHHEPAGGGEHLLVVEDEAALRGLLKEILSRLGYKVTVAANGGEALLLVEEEGVNPDLVITDVVMTGMSGLALSRRLRRRQPDLKVLFMSGYTDNAIVHHGVLDPGTPFIQKPFTSHAIAEQVRAVLRGGQ